MATNYPGSLDGTADVGGGVEPGAVTALDDSSSGHPTHAGLHQNLGDAVQQVETKVGIGSSSPSANKVLGCASGSTTEWTDSPSVANLTLSGNLNGTDADDLAEMVNNAGDTGFVGRRITVSATQPSSTGREIGDLWVEV